MAQAEELIFSFNASGVNKRSKYLFDTFSSAYQALVLDQHKERAQIPSKGGASHSPSELEAQQIPGMQNPDEDQGAGCNDGVMQARKGAPVVVLSCEHGKEGQAKRKRGGHKRNAEQDDDQGRHTKIQLFAEVEHRQRNGNAKSEIQDAD